VKVILEGMSAVEVGTGLDEGGEIVSSGYGRISIVVAYTSGRAEEVSSKCGVASDGCSSSSGISSILGGAGIGDASYDGGDCGGVSEIRIGAGVLLKR
jgi:hypothetical protein